MPNSPSREAAREMLEAFFDKHQIQVIGTSKCSCGMPQDTLMELTEKIASALTSARLQEREECAKLAENLIIPEMFGETKMYLTRLAAALRSRTEKEDGNG